MFSKKIIIPVSKIVLWIYILVAFVLGLLYFFSSLLPQKLEPLIGGGLVSIIAVLAQFLMSYSDYKNNEKLKKHRIIELLERRDDKKYYKKLIKSANKKLDLLFYTGKRFSEDFCQKVAEDDEIISCLRRGVKIRLLLSSENMLNDNDKNDLRSAIENFKKIRSEFPNQFDIKLYNHIHCHNIFSSELDTIVGPYFYNKRSKYSHSIHFATNAPYVADYLEYFESEWASAQNA